MNANEREYPAWGTARRVIGVFYEVFNELGAGFLESVYQEAMSVSLAESGLPVARQVPVDVWFRNRVIATFRAARSSATNCWWSSRPHEPSRRRMSLRQ
ncbi:MAG: GxxExxY protein [Gemmatimonadales bacterium]